MTSSDTMRNIEMLARTWRCLALSGGQGGALKYKLGVQVVCTIVGGGAPPAAWRKKTTLQGVFGDFGQVLEIHIQETS